MAPPPGLLATLAAGSPPPLRSPVAAIAGGLFPGQTAICVKRSELAKSPLIYPRGQLLRLYGVLPAPATPQVASYLLYLYVLRMCTPYSALCTPQAGLSRETEQGPQAQQWCAERWLERVLLYVIAAWLGPSQRAGVGRTSTGRPCQPSEDACALVPMWPPANGGAQGRLHRQ